MPRPNTPVPPKGEQPPAKPRRAPRATPLDGLPRRRKGESGTRVSSEVAPGEPRDGGARSH